MKTPRWLGFPVLVIGTTLMCQHLAHLETSWFGWLLIPVTFIFIIFNGSRYDSLLEDIDKIDKNQLDEAYMKALEDLPPALRGQMESKIYNQDRKIDRGKSYFLGFQYLIVGLAEIIVAIFIQ